MVDEQDAEAIAAAMRDVQDAASPSAGLDEILLLVTEAARANIGGVDVASVTVRYVDGRVETRAPTDELAVRADKSQYTHREGPCYEVAVDQQPLVSEDLGRDPRWPGFGADAAQLGLHSLYALEIFDSGTARGALNLYGREAGAFDGEDDLIRLFGVYAASVLGYAEEVDQLQRALETRGEIGRAVGIVMERYSLNERRAFAFLIRVSQTSNTKLSVVAQRIVATLNDTFGDDPSTTGVPQR